MEQNPEFFRGKDTEPFPQGDVGLGLPAGLRCPLGEKREGRFQENNQRQLELAGRRLFNLTALLLVEINMEFTA